MSPRANQLDLDAPASGTYDPPHSVDEYRQRVAAAMKRGAERQMREIDREAAAAERKARGERSTHDHTTGHDQLCETIAAELRARGHRAWITRVRFVEAHGQKQVLGVPGQSDIFAVLAPHGRFAGLEVKTGGAVPDARQTRWLERIRATGAIATVVHSVEEALAACGLDPVLAVPEAP
jgi:hypothetical protein